MTFLSHRRSLRLALHALMLVVVLGAPSAALGQEASPVFDPAGFNVRLETVATGFDQPLAVTDANDDTGRLFVAEKGGTIRVIAGDGTVQETPFLDITDRVGAGGSEQGLLGLAFPENFADSGVFYVDYTDHDGNTVVSRFSAGLDAGAADPGSEQVILRQEQPFANHNGGSLVFGPDNYLYIGFGDGGSQGDPNGNGQNLGTWLGKILRIEVDPEQVPEGQPYGIPEDNPFIDTEGALPEIWAYGVRNPWRFSFDRETGDFWLGDVGGGQLEEVDHVANADAGGQNFGWNIMEGTSCYRSDGCDEAGLTLPVFEYTHDFGCSITGGYVYRGEAMPDLAATYFFADYCSGMLWGGGQDASGAWVMSDPIETDLSISSFGENDAGEVYLTDLSGGGVYRLAPPL
jgi:glucose/arabinose dehydrogenase